MWQHHKIEPKKKNTLGFIHLQLICAKNKKGFESFFLEGEISSPRRKTLV